MASEILSMAAMLLGGLTFFLFGMSVMSGGLEQMAGGGLERTLKMVTGNDFLGFSVGAGITVAIQSSSAMTVMLVGLVNSGILAFEETFGMIMGSHVGTTLTAWILTLNSNTGSNFWMVLLKPMTFAPILAFVGIALRMLSKNEKKQKLGEIFIGFAILMVGMNMMSDSMADVKQYSNVLTAFSKSPALAFLVSTVFTGIIQSSAATVAIVQALAFSVGMDYQAAIPLIIGANIGTCMTAFISSIGTNKNAKRVVAMHVYTNAIGGVLCMIAMYIVMFVSPDLMTVKISMIGVAVVHSLFNIINTIFFIPFKKPLINLCKKTIKSDKTKTHEVFLDERIFNNTPIAISECRRLVNEMAQYARNAFLISIELINKYDAKTAEYVKEIEALTDKYEDKLSNYLVRISSNELTVSESHEVGRMIHSLSDFERIADHALNICGISYEISDKKIIFSKEATKELETLTDALVEIVNMTFDSFTNDDIDLAAHVEPLEQVIDKLKDELTARHVERLQEGKCTIQLGFVYSDILTNYERISDHCSNIAVYTLQLHSSKLDTHKFLRKYKQANNIEFKDEYNLYADKYKLDNLDA